MVFPVYSMSAKMTPDDQSMAENSISIVDINPSDMTLTTSPNQNVFQVEAVMDVTIDIGKTLTLAEYLAGGNVNNGDSSQIQIVDVFQPGQRFSAPSKEKSENFFHDFRFSEELRAKLVGM